MGRAISVVRINDRGEKRVGVKNSPPPPAPGIYSNLTEPLEELNTDKKP